MKITSMAAAPVFAMAVNARADTAPVIPAGNAGQFQVLVRGAAAHVPTPPEAQCGRRRDWILGSLAQAPGCAFREVAR